MIKDENYYQVSGWMVTKLKLKKYRREVYAIIYGFSQDGSSCFSGSINYLVKWLGCGRTTVSNTLKELTEEGFILKESTKTNGIIFNKYRHNPEMIERMVKLTPYSKSEHPPIQNMNRGSSKAEYPHSKAEYNNDIYTIEDNNSMKEDVCFAIDVLKIFKETTGKNITIEGDRAKGNLKLAKSILSIKPQPTLEEIKGVVQMKNFEWSWNPEMCENVRVSTIFRKSNFLKYLERLNQLKESPDEYSAFVTNINSRKTKTKKKPSNYRAAAKKHADEINENW